MIIVINRPTVERMIVAPRAGHARAEQGATDKFTHVARVGRELVKVGRTIMGGITLRRQQLAHDTVERDIIGDLLSKPGVIRPRSVVTELLRVDGEQIAELQSPEVNELRAG